SPVFSQVENMSPRQARTESASMMPNSIRPCRENLIQCTFVPRSNSPQAFRSRVSHAGAQGLEQQQRAESSGEIHRARANEKRMPSALGRGYETGERDQQRGGAFGRVEQTGVGRGKSRSERIAAGSRKQTVYLAPCKEHKAGKQDKCDRIVSEAAQHEYACSLQKKRNEHRILAAQSIRHPAKERPGDPVEHAVDGQGEGQGGQRQA